MGAVEVRSIRVSPDVVHQEVSGEMVLLDLKREIYFGLNEVGARIWEMINDGKSLDDVLDAIVSEFDVERSQADEDLHSLISSLAERELIMLPEGEGF